MRQIVNEENLPRIKTLPQFGQKEHWRMLCYAIDEKKQRNVDENNDNNTLLPAKIPNINILTSINQESCPKSITASCTSYTL